MTQQLFINGALVHKEPAAERRADPGRGGRPPSSRDRLLAGLLRLLKSCVTSFEQKLTKVVS
jgi:hypothetical protein